MICREIIGLVILALIGLPSICWAEPYKIPKHYKTYMVTTNGSDVCRKVNEILHFPENQNYLDAYSEANKSGRFELFKIPKKFRREFSKIDWQTVSDEEYRTSMPKLYDKFGHFSNGPMKVEKAQIDVDNDGILESLYFIGHGWSFGLNELTGRANEKAFNEYVGGAWVQGFLFKGRFYAIYEHGRSAHLAEFTNVSTSSKLSYGRSNLCQWIPDYQYNFLGKASKRRIMHD